MNSKIDGQRNWRNIWSGGSTTMRNYAVVARV